MGFVERYHFSRVFLREGVDGHDIFPWSSGVSDHRNGSVVKGCQVRSSQVALLLKPLPFGQRCYGRVTPLAKTVEYKSPSAITSWSTSAMPLRSELFIPISILVLSQATSCSEPHHIRGHFMSVSC